MLYQNVGMGGEAADILLQIGVEKKAEVIVMAEPWGEKGRRKQQVGYEIAYESKDIVVYTLKNSGMTVRGEGSWAKVEDVAVAYLRPWLNRSTVRARLREMVARGANTIMGDLNCHGNGKDRMLEEWIAQEELMDIGTAEYTHARGAHRCTIDRVLTRGNARPFVIPEQWDNISDHAIIGLRLQVDNKRKILKRIDWAAVEKYIEEEKGVRHEELRYVGEAYERLMELKRGKLEREVCTVGQSKRWWKKEWKGLRRRARKSKEAKRELRREIRKAKREM